MLTANATLEVVVVRLLKQRVHARVSIRLLILISICLHKCPALVRADHVYQGSFSMILVGQLLLQHLVTVIYYSNLR